ncbi:MAG: M23 family metallopeptidase [Bdellovibrionales bacterium]|nr:M23 family metallopeptidase [Bdellovibrionales bacterium]
MLLVTVSCHSRGGAIYYVEKGDTLWRIAHSHHVSMQEVLKANPRIRAHRLYPGQKVLLPGVSELKHVEKRVVKLIESRSAPPSQKLNKNTSVRKTQVQRSVSTKRKSFQAQFSWPARGKIASSFGRRDQKMHNGIDIELSPQSDIESSLEGHVIFVGQDIQGYGPTVIIAHAENLFTVYSHLGSILVQQGQKVRKSQTIAKAANQKGKAYLHFEIRQAKLAYDPLLYLPKA